jgi:hypothetical protein
MRLSHRAQSINSAAGRIPLLQSGYWFSPMLRMHPVIGFEEGAGERN